ncbi:MAG: hypothetical protein ACOX50_00960 [Patescibacteria group bacterium]|jgi:hypothetical protein
MAIGDEKKRVISHLIEFFFVGLLMGIVEDILAIKFATNAKITFDTFKVAFLVALPFAFINELLVDSKTIRKILFSKKTP